jgi:IS5 family transposase
MRPSRLPSGKGDLFRERLAAIIDPPRRLVRLAGLVPWSCFEDALGRFYRRLGRPTKPTRLMVGLHYLKHVHDLSDEEVVARAGWKIRTGSSSAASNSFSMRCRSTLAQ